MEECDAGMLQRVSISELNDRFGEGRYLLTCRHLIHRNEDDTKGRCIDDCCFNTLNQRFHGHETIVCENADMPTRLAAAYDSFHTRAYGQPPGFSLLGSSNDWSQAYRQIPVFHLRFSIIAVWNPRKRRVEFYLMWGHMFGAGKER